MKKVNPERLSFRLNTKMKKDIEAIALANETTTSEVVRHSLTQFINKKK